MAGTAGAIRAGQAFIEMGLNNDPLTKGLKAAESQLKGFGIAVTQIGAAAGAAGAAITVPLLAMAKIFAEGTSALQHMSERTGISIEALSALGYAAKQTGLDLSEVEIAIKKMQKSMTAGSLENQQAAQTFANLGLNVKKLEQLKPEEAFEVLAQRISEIPNPTAKAGAAMLIFGKSGTSILPLIENMAALTKEAKDFGLVASTKGVEAGTRLQHAFNLLDKSIAFTQGTIASALAPTLTEMNAAFARNLKTVREWIAANKPLVLQAFQIGLALTAVGTVFATLGAAFIASGAVLGGVATTLAAIGAALAALTSPISLVIAAIAGLGTWFLKSTETGQQSLAFIGKQFQQLKAEAIATFGGIAEALKAGDIVLAGQILWTGLQVEWLKGKVILLGIWNDFGVSMVAKTIGIKDSIVSTMKNAWDLIGLGFKAVTIEMLNAWDSFTVALLVPWNNFVSIVQISWEVIKGIALEVFGILQEQWGLLVATGTRTFEILMQQWQLFTTVFARPIEILRQQWEVLFAAVGRAIDVLRGQWDVLTAAFLRSIEVIKGQWDVLIGAFKTAADVLAKITKISISTTPVGIAGQGLATSAAGKVTGSQAAKDIANIQESTARKNEDLQKGAAESAKKRQDELAAKAQSIEDARLKAQKELEAKQKAADEARKKASDDELAKSESDLAKLQAELKALQAKAKEGAGKLGPLAEEGKAFGEQPEFTPKELDKSIASTTRKTLDTKGSFSAQAVRGFGSEEPLNITMREVLKENRQTNKHLTDISKKASEGQQVFGR
jgi:hypothetical protein